MKKYLTLIFCFLFFNIYSQSFQPSDTIYFLINKNDTLIKKQLSTKINKYEGYTIIDEKKIVKIAKRSIRKKPIDEVLKKGEIWISEGDDIEYDTFNEISFSFDRSKDAIVSQQYIGTLNIIRDRRQFLDVIKHLDQAWLEFVFIEPIKCDKFILRRVYPLIFE